MKVVLTEPPDVPAQIFAEKSGLPVETKYTVFGVLNVMFLHSPRLPMRVPLMGADVPLT